MPLSFSKEVVPDVVPKGSLLASALLSQAPREKQGEDVGVQLHEYLQSHQSPSDNFTVSHVSLLCCADINSDLSLLMMLLLLRPCIYFTFLFVWYRLSRPS